MNTKEKSKRGKAIMGIAMAVIMLASVFAAMVPTVSAVSRSDNFNHIAANDTEIVLVGQNVYFWAPDVEVQRMDDGVWYYYDGPWTDGKTYDVNWDPALTLRATNGTAGENTSLAVKDHSVKLKLKVGTEEVSSLTLGTNLTISTSGTNLFANDTVDLEIIGPGDLRITTKNGQLFENITVAALKEFGNASNTSALINTTGWKIGDYTFQVKTKPVYACGLSANSGVEELTILKGEIDISAEETTVIELKTIKLTVTGVSGDNITLNATPSDHVLFQGGTEDTPAGVTGDNFADEIDEDGKKTYAVKFNDTGTYTITATVTSEGPRKNDDDTVDITVTERGVTFDLPITLVIGEKFTMRGTANTGTTVDVFVDGKLYKKFDDMVLADGEFSEEVTVDNNIGMSVPGSVRLKAWIDCPTDAISTDTPDRPADGDTAMLLIEPGLTAEISVETVAQEDSFYVKGTANGARSVDVLTISPKGASGKGIHTGDVPEYDGLTQDSPSVSDIDDSFSQKITVNENAGTGRYLVAVLYEGRDGYYGTNTSNTDIIAALGEYGSLAGKTQEQILAMLVDLTTGAGSDDLIWLGKIKVEAAKVTLDTIADVAIGEPLAVAGTTNREEGHTILITAKGPVELTPEIALVENGTFSATFDTTDAEVGTYTVTVDDGDGHTDDATVEILKEVVPTPTPTPEPTAEPTEAPVPTAEPTAEPTPTPEEPGFEAVFAIAGLLSIAYLVLRRRK